MANRERLIELGWRQGVLLVPNDERFKENSHYEVPDDARLLVVSQTCDLVQGSFDREPYFEVLCIHPLGQAPKGEYLAGKNSRRVEFTLEAEGGSACHWYALPYERHLVGRDILLERQASEFLDDGQILKMILRWLSRRYTRIAFPEEFLCRLAARKSKINRKFNRLNPLVGNIFVRVTPFTELDGSSSYSLDMLLVMDAEKYDDSAQYDQCNEIKKELERQLGECAGIEIDDISIESTATVTLEDLSGYLDWDFSYLSFRNPDEAVMPADAGI